MIGPFVEDMKAILSQIIKDGFTHICCIANEVAHRIACFAFHIGTTLTWFEEPLDFLVDVLF